VNDAKQPQSLGSSAARQGAHPRRERGGVLWPRFQVAAAGLSCELRDFGWIFNQST
jgi:hypothetical protein